MDDHAVVAGLVMAHARLGAGDKRTASLVCRDWKHAVDVAWADQGVRVRGDVAAVVLAQPRWKTTKTLTVWNPSAGGLPWRRVAFEGLPRDFPHLHTLTLHQPSFRSPDVAEAVVRSVFAAAPRLAALELAATAAHDMLNASSYAANLRAARTVLAEGAGTLTAVTLRACRLISYPAPATTPDGPVPMDRLACYVNTGGGFSGLAVDAPLVRAHIEEQLSCKPGNWLAARLGPRCDGLRHLAWKAELRTVPAPRLCFLSRYARLETLCLEVTAMSPSSVPHVLASLALLPPTLTSLQLTVEYYPDCPVSWEHDVLSHLPRLSHLSIRVMYPVAGFERACGLLGAGPGVESAVLASTFKESSDDMLEEFEEVDDTCMDPVDFQSGVLDMLASRPGVHLTCVNLPLNMTHSRLITH